MLHSTLKKHTTFSVDQYDTLQSTESHKVSLLKQYIKQLQLHIAYLQRQLDRYKTTNYLTSIDEILSFKEKKQLIQQNKILSGQCFIKQQELLNVIQDNRLLSLKLDQISGQEKNKTIQMLVEMNKKLQEVNIENQMQISQYGKLQIINNQIRMQLQRLSNQCTELRDQLFDKRHAYTKFKLCMAELKSLEAKYLQFDPSYKQILSFYKTS